MSEQEATKQVTISEERCYLCDDLIGEDKSLEINLTTGDKVKTHKVCLELYLEQMSASCNTGSSCSSCSSSSSCNI
ncbi:MAG: hypothetical protein KAR35_04235 [Candidatus Heimdallarchaeota archaeon]|nr:hypothetical protein [Candidatus Heimdallarchaeota archaeon]MCK5048563.1 hypothetical protein [Candidatus Heimdallarchaeota archaeon]